MTKQAKNFIKNLSKNLAHTQAIGEYMLVYPTNLIVRGIHLERTSRKDEYYVWRFLFPIYSPIVSTLPLTYSKRISLDGRGDSIINLGSNVEEQASLIAEKIEKIQDYKEILENIDVNDFLRICRPSRENLSPVRALNLAVSYYIIGDISKVREILANLIAQEKPFFFLTEAKEIANSMLKWLVNDPIAFNEYISNTCKRNADKYFPGLITGSFNEFASLKDL